MMIISLYKIVYMVTSPTGHTDFTVVQHSITNNGLPCDKWFCFQGNIVKANHTWESISAIYALLFKIYKMIWKTLNKFMCKFGADA
jgi:hypothetical protein